jgi:hypothetical protein
MPQNNRNDELLAQLRAMVEAGAPQTPVKSHGPAPGSIGAPSGINRPMPISDEPLAEGNDFMSLINRTPLGLLGDAGNPLEAVGPIGGPGRFKQPMASETRMKELVRKFGGFQLPDGRIAAQDVEGTHRMLDGEQAMKMYNHLTKTPVSRLNAESAAAPAVSGAHELSDVAVPLADSLDTAATPKLPLSQIMRNTQDSLKRKSTKISHPEILAIRQAFDNGKPLSELQKEYPHLTDATVSEVARRLSFVNVK